MTNPEHINPERVDPSAAARVHGVAARKARGRDCCCMSARCEAGAGRICVNDDVELSAVWAHERPSQHTRQLYVFSCESGRRGSAGGGEPVRRWQGRPPPRDFVVVAAV